MSLGESHVKLVLYSQKIISKSNSKAIHLYFCRSPFLGSFFITLPFLRRLRQRFASNFKIHAICYKLQFSYVACTSSELFFLHFFLNATKIEKYYRLEITSVTVLSQYLSLYRYKNKCFYGNSW